MFGLELEVSQLQNALERRAKKLVDEALEDQKKYEPIAQDSGNPAKAVDAQAQLMIAAVRAVVAAEFIALSEELDSPVTFPSCGPEGCK